MIGIGKARELTSQNGRELDNVVRDFSQIRHITIFNEYDMEMELTGYFENPIDPFLNEVKGFGHSKNLSTFYLGTREIITEKKIQLNDLSGTLLFYNNANNESAYTQMNNFRMAVGLSEKLYIKYTIPYNQTETILEFYPELTCQVEYIDEQYGEISKDSNMIEMPVTFKRMTPWKSNIRQNDVVNNDGFRGTRTYKPDDSYTYNENEGLENPVYGAEVSGETELDIFGTATTYPQITIYGPTVNPTIVIKDYSDNTIKNMTIQGIYSETDIIVIDTDPTNYSFTLNNTSNIYPQVKKGIGYDTYLALAPGKYNLLYTNPLGGDAGKVVVSYFWEYL